MPEQPKPAWEQQTPTNGEAARRGYCRKHSRAMLDIGGEKKCPVCQEKKRAKAK